MVRVIAVTGAAGYIGKRLIPYLNKHMDIDNFIGIDRQNMNLDPSIPFTFYKMDIREKFYSILKDHDVTDLIHLAWLLNPVHNAKQAYEVDVLGTQNVINQAHKANIQYLLHTSSTLSYGAFPDNPFFLMEDDKLRGNRNFHYAYHKALAEELIDKFLNSNPKIGLQIGRIRPSAILAADTDNYISEILQAGWRTFYLLPYPNKDTRIQFLHLNDALEGFRIMIEKRLEGAYNVTPDTEVRVGDIPSILHKERRGIQIPLSLLKLLLGIQWRLRISRAPPSYLDFVAHTFVAANDKIKKEGFVPKYSTKDTLCSLLEN